MTKQRLDNALVERKLTSSRSQAESYIKLGKVTVDGRVVPKPGHFVGPNSAVAITAEVQYVSRAGLKLASVADVFKLDFRDKVVLDVGSSTGGFTDYSLKNGARKVYAVDVGTDQLHPSLRRDKRVESHEKTDIRDVYATATNHLPSTNYQLLNDIPDIVLIDVSFISLREILPHLYNHLSGPATQVVAMVKPQFEAGAGQTNKGVIKNDSMRRQILRDFEDWARGYFVIIDKRDSDVAGAKGNQERFYLLNKVK
ncbi:MAG: TlyA family RNA methyltransferase [Candidatus Saccharibacteria bacterium]